MRWFLRLVGFLLVTGGSFAALDLWSHDLNRATSLLGLGLLFASFTGQFAGARRPGRSSLVTGALCLIAALPVAIAAPLGIASFHLLVMAAAALLAERAPRGLRAELNALVAAFAIVVLFAELDRLLPLVWHAQQAIAALLSNVSARLAHEPRNLGPTAMGLPILGALLAFVLGRAAAGPEDGKPRAVTAVAALAAVHLGYLVLLTPYAAWMGRHYPTHEHLVLNSQWLFFLIGALTLALVNHVSARRAEARCVAGLSTPTATEPAPFSWRGVGKDSRLVTGFCLGIMLVLLFGRHAAPPDAPVRVLLYDAGYTNWEVPGHGRYGEHSAGMFGVLPGLLQAAGHHVERSADLGRLDAQEPPDCLVLINIQEYFKPADKERVLRFVHNGGGLLCLGDHTGVAGIRGPFNDLLSGLGIRLAFDSATFFASGWSNALERRNHAVNRGVVNDEDYQIWVGASLEIEPTVAPVIVARYGWSDLGDMSNVERAYLGDRRYNPNELLGDLVLAAEARYGRGKVLMFGDTSTYQNLSLPRSSVFVRRSIEHLAHPGGAAPGAGPQVVALVLLAALLGLVTGGGTFMLPIGAVCAGLLAASTGLAVFARAPAPAPLDCSRAAPLSATDAAHEQLTGTAIVDRSHGGRFDLRAWNDQSIGGLTLNLMRDGLFPIVSERFPDRELDRADAVFVIAPQRSYAPDERRTLRRFMERGGKLIVCVGGEDLDGARELLRDYEFGVRPLPMAHFRTGPDKTDLAFLDAWSLECPRAAHVLVRQWGEPVVASLDVGQGQIVLIGDSRFLLNRNLEGRESWFPGNIALLSALARGTPVQPVEGKFEDPRRQGVLADAAAAAQPAAESAPPVATVAPVDSTRAREEKRP